jgi:hypothetical protein
VVAAIAQDPKWSAQKNVRFGLVRAASEVSPQIESFLAEFTLTELADLVSLDQVASPIRTAVQQEIAKNKIIA